MIRRSSGMVVVFLAMMGTLGIELWPQSAAGITAQVEQLASRGSKGDRALSESIAAQIDENPKDIATLLLPKLKEPSASESQLATYAWALGRAKDPQATESLMTLYRKSSSDWVRSNCLRALAMIGGSKNGDFLISVLDGRSDQDERYKILDLLSEMQYEPALSRAEDVLKLDCKEYYWKPIFIFGKMGDKAIPFLLSKIGSDDLNVRTHVVHLLGQWLVAPEAAEAMRKRFWEERDPELRVAILGAIEGTESDLGSWRPFFEKVKEQSKDPSCIQFAGETLASIDQIKTSLKEFMGKKSISRADFDREYIKLLRSAGQDGDYDVLERASSLADEPKLKRLREHILTRNSDESFYDYKKVSNIIALNRLASGMKGQK